LVWRKIKENTATVSSETVVIAVECLVIKEDTNIYFLGNRREVPVPKRVIFVRTEADLKMLLDISVNP